MDTFSIIIVILIVILLFMNIYQIYQTNQTSESFACCAANSNNAPCQNIIDGADWASGTCLWGNCLAS